MTDSVKLPYYARITIMIVGLFFLIYILYIGQAIFIPIAYSLIFSILLIPLVSLLQKLKLNRVVAIAIAIVLAFLAISALVYFILSQVSLFDKAIPMMREKLNQLQFQFSQWISVHFNVSIQRIDDWFTKTRSDLLENGNAMIGKTILTISGFLIAVFVVPVYMFMILYYEPLLLVFTKKLVSKTHHEKLEDVMLLTKGIVQSYLNGLLIEAVIIAVMNSIALLIIGVDYAILLGIIGALLNMIPYIGGIVAVAIPMIIALFTKDSAYYSLLVLAAYMLIQFIDNHYITPKIVASKVKINALIALIVVFIGNALWGIPGMFLAIPVTGMLKVIFEHIDSLKPWAFLLGDTMPSSRKYIFKLSGRKKKTESEEAPIIKNHAHGVNPGK